LAVNRAWQRARDRRSGQVKPSGVSEGAPPAEKPPVLSGQEVERPAVVMTPSRILAVVATFHFVCFAWIFFRAPTLAHAWLIITRIGKATMDAPNISGRLLTVLAIGLLTHFVPKTIYERLRAAFVASPAVVQGALLAGCAYLLHFAAGAK